MSNTMIDKVTIPDDALTTETVDGWTIQHWLDPDHDRLSLSFVIGDESDGEDGWSYFGWLKWDGCINWQTGDCYAHACHPDDVDKLKRAFEALYVLGAERLRSWCG